MNRDMRIHHVRPLWVRGLIALGLLVAAPAARCPAQPGQVVGWGNSLAGRYNAQPNDECMAICAGGYHSLALTADGTLMAWGENTNGQCNIPYGNNFVAIAAGLYHNLALKADGTVVAWGDNSRGQCNFPRNTKFRAIAAGTWHSLGIRLDGSLAAWGWNDQGQCRVPAGKDYTDICGGYYHSMALKVDGSIVAWGSNGDGQASVPTGVNFIQIVAGTLHSLALKADGTIVAWGRSSEGQCRVPSGNDFVAIAAGSLHNLALRRDGRIEAWGQNSYGQCDPPEGSHFAVISAGEFHSLAIRDLRRQFLPAKPAEHRDARVKDGESPTTSRTAVSGVREQTTSPGLADLALAGEVKDSNSITTEQLLSKLEQRQPIQPRQTDTTMEKSPGKDPNAAPATPANAGQTKVVQEPNHVEPVAAAPIQTKDPNATQATPVPADKAKAPDAAKTAPPRQPASAREETTPAEPAKPPTTAAADPNKPAIDLENPMSQGFAPSIYMGVIENAAPVYHFVSTTSKRHFCTISEEEKYELLDHHADAWKYQGIAFFAYPEGRQPKDARPVYRFWSESLNQYFYTMDETTKEMAIKDLSNVWKFEGAAWYAPPVKQPEQKK